MINVWKIINKEVKNHKSIRFVTLVLLIVLYGIFVSYKFGFESGFLITALTWSFFVLCTPIADGGIIIDFPVRLLTNIKMIYSEIVVWVVAISINIYAFTQQREIYSTTLILDLFEHILSQPFPYWIIILLSAIGTFLSIYMGDEIFTAASYINSKKHHKHKMKFKLIFFIFLILITIVLYDFLLKTMGIHFF